MSITLKSMPDLFEVRGMFTHNIWAGNTSPKVPGPKQPTIEESRMPSRFSATNSSFRKPVPDSGYVYFIAPEAWFLRQRDADEVRVKIGYTKHDPKLRLDALQSGSPVSLQVIAYIDGSVALERDFHNAFANLGSHGEWFFIKGKLRELLYSLEDGPRINSKHFQRNEFTDILYDTVFCDSLPNGDACQEEYLCSADVSYLSPWFPEAVRA